MCNARAQDAPERRAARAKVSRSQAKNMAFLKLALLALAVGANAADDDQVVVGQTFMAGAIDPTSGSTGWALTISCPPSRRVAGAGSPSP